MSPHAAWARLAEGNARFAAGQPTEAQQSTRRRLEGAPAPFACVLGCLDGRVPPELVFDVGLGDLMTVRSGGAALDSAVLGSVEFAVTQAGVRLVVVLGHADCLAVRTTVGAVHDGRPVHGQVANLVRAIEPAVRETAYDIDREALVTSCIRNQTRRVARDLIERAPELAEAAASKRDPLVILPAVYDMTTGLVRPEFAIESSEG